MILFCGGCLFSYTILIPVALNVSIYVNVFMGIDLMRAVDEFGSWDKDIKTNGRH
tara:strand:+ start:14775 stop:14939 length:165 start_codon:yes stop_codon:yes gene_type:complete